MLLNCANDRFKTFSINLNAQHLNGIAPFDLAVRLLDTLKYFSDCNQVYCRYMYVLAF